MDPGQAAPHRNLGVNLLSAKNYDAAASELHDAARLDPKDPFAHFYLLSLALATGRDEDAVEQAHLAGPLIEHDPDIAADLAEAEIRTGRIEEAATAVTQLEQSNRLSLQREYRIATAFAQRSAYPQTVNCFRHMASVDSTWENRFNLALALLYDKQPAEAALLLATLHSEVPGNADILTFLGSADEMLDKIPQALEAYRAAAGADPSNPDRMLDYTRVLMDSDDYDEALQVIQSGPGSHGFKNTAPGASRRY